MRLIDGCDINPKARAIDDSTEVSFVAMPDVSEDGKINTGIIRQYYEVKKGFTCFQEGDVLFAKITPCMENGKGALAVGLKNGIGCGSTEFHVLRPDTKVLQGKWLYYLTSWSAFRKDAERHMTGSAGQKRVPKAYLEKYELRIPPLTEQLYQIKALDHVKSIIELRKREIQNLDELVKARFVEMFGDPETNCNGYPLKKLDNLVTDIIAGWSANGEARQKNDNEKAVLKVSAVTQGFFKPEEHKALPADIKIKKYVFPHKGDLLFSRANTRELVGATAIIEHDYPDLLLPDKLWRVLFTNELNTYYAKYVLSTEAIRKKFSVQSTGTSGSMYNVSSEKFRNITIPVPARALQDDFEEFVHQVDKSKVAVQKSLDETQKLFDSLMQEYFG